MKNHYSYDFAEALKTRDERPSYCRFAVMRGDQKVVEFWTNKSLEGLFYWSDYDGSYRQSEGTCDFSMPSTPDAIRRKLKKMADKAEHGMYA